MENVPSNLKTGFDNLLNDDNKWNIIGTICHFTENALKTASFYVEHCKRNGITKEDIKRSLILEVFLFGKRENLSENIKNIIRDIKENPNDDNDDLNDIIIPNDELNAFAISNCDCALCKTMNSIYDKWNAFQPSSNIEKIMKKHIDTMDEEDWDDTSSDDESSSDEY